MTRKYWIKLYHEILNDRKMVRLDDRLWRRAIECFLLAGETGDDGFLPPLEDIAFAFRVDNVEQLETELNELVNVGILEIIDTRYYVQAFAKRQETMSKAEYMRRLRKQRQDDEYYQAENEELPNSYQSVTNGNTDKIRIEENNNKSGKVMTAFDNNIAPLTPMSSEIVGEWIDEYSNDWILEAIKIAVEQNVRKPRYVEKILENWQANGKGSFKGKKGEIPEGWSHG